MLKGKGLEGKRTIDEAPKTNIRNGRIQFEVKPLGGQKFNRDALEVNIKSMENLDLLEQAG